MRKKILCVDDSPTALMWERMILKDGPYDIITAKDGDDGVRLAKSEKPDLILMDVIMPRMNGIDACRAIRAVRELHHVPIFLVTTRSEMANVLAGYESGCNEYVMKPIDRAELLMKVRMRLGESASAPAAGGAR